MNERLNRQSQRVSTWLRKGHEALNISCMGRLVLTALLTDRTRELDVRHERRLWEPQTDRLGAAGCLQPAP